MLCFVPCRGNAVLYMVPKRCSALYSTEVLQCSVVKFDAAVSFFHVLCCVTVMRLARVSFSSKDSPSYASHAASIGCLPYALLMILIV